jgi:hypothetical protein
MQGIIGAIIASHPGTWSIFGNDYLNYTIYLI